MLSAWGRLCLYGAFLDVDELVRILEHYHLAKISLRTSAQPLPRCSTGERAQHAERPRRLARKGSLLSLISIFRVIPLGETERYGQPAVQLSSMASSAADVLNSF